MVNCNFENYGCSGGYLMTSIDYLQIEGLISNQCTAYKGAVGTCSYACDDHTA